MRIIATTHAARRHIRWQIAIATCTLNLKAYALGEHTPDRCCWHALQSARGLVRYAWDAAPQIVATLESLFDTLCLVSQSDHLFLAPRVVLRVGGFESLLMAIPVREALPGADVCLIQPKHAPLSPAAHELSAMLASYAHMLRKRADAA